MHKYLDVKLSNWIKQTRPIHTKPNKKPNKIVKKTIKFKSNAASSPSTNVMVSISLHNENDTIDAEQQKQQQQNVSMLQQIVRNNNCENIFRTSI